MHAKPVFSVNLTKEAFDLLTELRDEVEAQTGEWLPLGKIVNNLIFNVYFEGDHNAAFKRTP